MSWEAGVMMVGVGILWYLAILIISTDETHAAFKLFLLLISAWYSVALVNLGLQFATDASAGAGIVNGISVLYQVVVWIARIMTTYYVFYYFYYLFNYIKERLERKRFGK